MQNNQTTKTCVSSNRLLKLYHHPYAKPCSFFCLSVASIALNENTLSVMILLLLFIFLLIIFQTYYVRRSLSCLFCFVLSLYNPLSHRPSSSPMYVSMFHIMITPFSQFSSSSSFGSLFCQHSFAFLGFFSLIILRAG